MRLVIGAALLCGASILAVPATAGGCGYGGACAPGVSLISEAPVHVDDVLVSVDAPLGHLRSVDYRRSPHVSVTRIHTQDSTIGLDDKPIGFTGGCHPESTAYCSAGSHVPAAPVAPIIAPPLAPAPVPVAVVQGPMVQAPVVQQTIGLRRWTASYDADPSRFIPRQYGSLDFVPGIAHVPSSWVDRDPARAQAALNASGAGGIAPGPQIGLQRIPDDTPGPIIPPGQFQGPAPVPPGAILQPGPASHAPEVAVVTRGFGAGAPAAPLMANIHPAPTAPVAAIRPAAAIAFGTGPIPGPVGTIQRVAPSGTVVPNLSPIGYPAQPSAPALTASGHYASQVAADGTYWEKVSGPTMMGDTLATQVICKRQLETEIVNPVVGVPTPVPVDCGPAPHPAHGPAIQHAPVPQLHTQGLAGGAGGHWTY